MLQHSRVPGEGDLDERGTLLAAQPRDPESLKQAFFAALGATPDTCDERVVDSYRTLLRRTWERMAAVVGREGAHAIVSYAIKVASRRHSETALVTVAADGPDISRLEALLVRDRRQELCRCLEALYLAIFQTLADLTGEVVVGPLLDELKQRRGPSP